MRSTRWIMLAGMALIAAAPAARADRRGLDVEVWTDRGNEAVYQPGDRMEVRVRTSDDAYLLVYEVDAEGRVNLLFPDLGSRGFVEGRSTLQVPSESSNLDLVVEEPVGEGFIVAIASAEPFRDLPWYLRPFDARAHGVGYEGAPNDEEGVTSEGRIVGDPFVAMERVRRRVVADASDPSAFGTAYTTYYVHHEVRYPRYLCYDCHRPNRWAWWDGFDPYYTHCSVFDFRVNWNWGWGPSYWYGAVPYYYYVYRVDCPPRYRVYNTRNVRYSSWDGWGRWNTLWGGNLRRYKSDPPANYVPPTKYKERTATLPPGFFSPRQVPRGRQEGGLVPVQRERRDLGDRSDPRESRGRSALPQRPRETWRDEGRSTGRDATPQARERGRDNRPNLEGSRESLRRDTRPQVGRNDRGSDSGRETPRYEPSRGRQEAPRSRPEEPRVQPRREERRGEATQERGKSDSGDKGDKKEKRTNRPPRG